MATAVHSRLAGGTPSKSFLQAAVFREKTAAAIQGRSCASRPPARPPAHLPTLFFPFHCTSPHCCLSHSQVPCTLLTVQAYGQAPPRGKRTIGRAQKQLRHSLRKRVRVDPFAFPAPHAEYVDQIPRGQENDDSESEEEGAEPMSPWWVPARSGRAAVPRAADAEEREDEAAAEHMQQLRAYFEDIDSTPLAEISFVEFASDA